MGEIPDDEPVTGKDAMSKLTFTLHPEVPMDLPGGGAVTLRPHIQEGTRRPPVDVIPDEAAADRYGVPERAGQVIGGYAIGGGIIFPTAYTDYAHLRADVSASPERKRVFDLPSCRTAEQAVCALLAWWGYVKQRQEAGADPHTLDPASLTAEERAQLFG